MNFKKDFKDFSTKSSFLLAMATYMIGALGAAGCAAGISKALGIEIPSRVTCWFCSHRQTVKFSQRNSYDCASCGQYNGFKADGDYNKEIQGQYSEVPVVSKYTFADKKHEKAESKSRLCDTCNRNQEMKIYQLKQFVPSNPRKEDQELQDYTAHLERTYRLCRPCEAKVRQVLGEQDSSLRQRLLAWKLSLFRKSPLLISAKDTFELSMLGRILLMFWSLVIWIASWPISMRTAALPQSWLEIPFLPSNFGYFEIVTVAVPLMLAIYYCQIKSVSSLKWQHWCNIVLWLGLFVQRMLEASLLKTELASLTLLCSFVVSMQPKQSKDDKIQQKRNQRQKLYQDLSHEEEPSEEYEAPEPEEVEEKCNSKSPIIVEQEGSSDDMFLPNHEIVTQHSQPREENQCDLSTLQINGRKLRESSLLRPQSPFSIKSYQQENTANSSAIDFGDVSRCSIASSGSFIKPATFVYNDTSRVAQSSWVAGGYWHPNNQKKGQTLSRASSQSSGIGSLTSAGAFNNVMMKDFVSSLPNSRVNSTYGGNVERFSIFSEPAYTNLNSTLVPNPVQFRSQSQLGNNDIDEQSLNSSFGRLSQEAFDKLKPQAKSSPKTSDDSRESTHIKSEDEVSFLERKITIRISMYSIFLFLSVGVNVSLSAYLFSLYFWH